MASYGTVIDACGDWMSVFHCNHTHHMDNVFLRELISCVFLDVYYMFPYNNTDYMDNGLPRE